MSNLKDRPDNIGRLQEKLAKKNLDGTSIKEIQRNEPFLIAYTGCSTDTSLI